MFPSVIKLEGEKKKYEASWGAEPGVADEGGLCSVRSAAKTHATH